MRERGRQGGPAISRRAGFTLFELMIAVAVVAILSAVAYPSYISYITRANRSAAQGFLLEVANRQERFLLDNRAYAANIAALGVTVPNNVSANYTITTNTPSARTSPPSPSFDAVATPTGKQLANDTQCGTMTLDETGTKSATGTSGPSWCWRS